MKTLPIWESMLQGEGEPSLILLQFKLQNTLVTFLLYCENCLYKNIE